VQISKPSPEEERLREQLRSLQQKEQKEVEQQIIQSEVTNMQQRKKEVRNLIKKDMREQSESVKQRLAMRTRKRHASM